MERVLFVDSDSAMQGKVAQALQDVFVLRYAQTGTEALGSLQRRLPDLIVSEVDLPDMSGLALCERLRADPATSGLPILLLTTRADIRDKVAGFMAGADDYVVKPFDPRFFSSRLRLLLRLKGMRQKPSGGDDGSSSRPPTSPAP